jgi:hypothetical protein
MLGDRFIEALADTLEELEMRRKQPDSKCPSCNLLYVEDLEDCCVVCGYHALRGIWARGSGCVDSTAGYGLLGVGGAWDSMCKTEEHTKATGATQLPVPSAGQSTSK